METRSPASGGQDVVHYLDYDASERLVFKSVPYLVPAYTGGPGASACSIPDSTQPGTSYTYDALGRQTGQTDALSDTTTTSYSIACVPTVSDVGCYEQTAVVDPDQHKSATLTDGLGRKAYVQSYIGNGSSG